MRHEIKRFVYMCDGLERDQKHCENTQVIDAVDERAADGIAKGRGWKFNAEGQLLCGKREHIQKIRRPRERRPRPDPTTCEHYTVRVNDMYYVCTKCGKGGSEKWAAEFGNNENAKEKMRQRQGIPSADLLSTEKDQRQAS